jgi:hypothetical protein
MFILFLIILIIIISFKYNYTPENFTGSSLEYIYDQIDPIYLETPNIKFNSNNEFKEYNTHDYDEFLIDPIFNTKLKGYNSGITYKNIEESKFEKKIIKDNITTWKCRNEISRPWFFC